MFKLEKAICIFSISGKQGNSSEMLLAQPTDLAWAFGRERMNSRHSLAVSQASGQQFKPAAAGKQLGFYFLYCI